MQNQHSLSVAQEDEEEEEEDKCEQFELSEIRKIVSKKKESRDSSNERIRSWSQKNSHVYQKRSAAPSHCFD